MSPSSSASSPAGVGLEAESSRALGDDEGAASILLIEDDLDARMLVESALDQAGFRGDVHTVQDGANAITLAQEAGSLDRFGLVLLDLGLPKADGIEVLEAIRERANRETLPVVMLTNQDDEALVARAYDRGANCWIRKPARYEDLEATIQHVLTFWHL